MKLLCTNNANYKGKAEPTCHCVACWIKFIEQHRSEPVTGDTLLKLLRSLEKWAAGIQDATQEMVVQEIVDRLQYDPRDDW